MKKNKITLKQIAGYTTENTVWKLIVFLLNNKNSTLLVSPDNIVVDNDTFAIDTSVIIPSDSYPYFAPECEGSNNVPEELAAVWTIGAIAFYVVMGIDVFEGQGGKTQTVQTEIPRISSSHVSSELSQLIFRCLSYHPEKRPLFKEIEETVGKVLSIPKARRQRPLNRSGKTYATSLVKFWPEEMVSILVFLIVLFSPISTYGQKQFTVPDEMASLVWNCCDLRTAGNSDKVTKKLRRDMKWTMMDELEVSQNECTEREVKSFGLNTIGFKVLAQKSGVTNAGGRFRDGRDARYQYSFIEIGVKKGKEVKYTIEGREGDQIFAVVPYDENAKFKVSVAGGGEPMSKDGVVYVSVKKDFKKTDKFTLAIRNDSPANMAFVIINYNSRHHE